MLKKFILFLYILSAKWLPMSRHFFLARVIRNFYCRLIIDKCGKHINVEKGASFSPKIKLGDYSGLGVRCEIGPYTSIGKYVMMGQDVIILTRNHKFDKIEMPIKFQGYQNFKPVKIEDNVWIGSRVIILPGITVSEGSIIGAGSIVTKDIPKFSIVAGNPAKIIRRRADFEETK